MPAKPLKVRYDWETCVIDGVIARRVQTLGSTTDLTEERILELGNSGYAEVMQNEATDRVAITMDTNDFGSVNTIALLANKYDKPDPSHSSAADYKTTIAGGFTDAGSGSGTEGDNTYWVKMDNLDTAAVDITAPLSEGGTDLSRTAFMGNCALNSLSLSYDVGGQASENYSLQTNNKRWYLGWKKRAVPEIAYYETAFAAYVSGTDLTAVSDLDAIAFTINGDFITDPENLTLTASGTGTRIDKSPAFTFDSGDRLRLVYAISGSSTYTQLPSTPAGLGAIRRGYVDIYIAEGSAPTSKTLRLQSVTIDVDLSRETLEQLGSDAAYSTTLQTPIPISVTASLNDSDLDLWAKLAGVTLTDYSTTELSVDDFLSDKELFVKIYKSKTSHVAGNLVKLLHATSMTVTGETHNLTVGDIASQEFTFLVDNLIVSGTGVSSLL